jgi:hypothetical protein
MKFLSTPPGVICREWKRRWRNRVFPWEILIILLAIAGFCCIMSQSLTPWVEPSPQKVSIPIVSLETNTHTKGWFVLWVGSIEGVESYYYMRDLGNNSYVREHVPCKGTIIKEKDSVKPNVTYYLWDSWSSPRNITITVPVGTVVQRFEIK